MDESVEKQIKEHMDEFSKGLVEYKRLNEKNIELIQFLEGMPYEKVVKIMAVVGEVVTLSVEATVKGIKEAERIAEVYANDRD